MKNKRFLIILLIVLISLIAILIGWRIIFPGSSQRTIENFRDVLPFGDTGNYQPATDDQQQTANSDTPIFDGSGRPTSNLFRIVETPVAGMIAINKDEASNTVVRYVDRATGHIHDINLTTMEATRVTNQTLPKIYEAHFRSDGNAVLLRSLKGADVVENLSLALTPPASTSTDALYTISATILRGDIKEVAVGSGNTLYYVLQNPSSIVSSNFNGSNSRILFVSPFRDWRLSPSGSNLYIYSKASATASGYAYSLNSSSGTITKLLGPLNGLAILPNRDSTQIIYSFVENGNTGLHAKANSSASSVNLGFNTLAEKCVWSQKSINIVYCGVPLGKISSNEPDNWYQGLTKFSDRIWIISGTDSESEPFILAEPKQSLGIDIDVYNPRLSSKEDYLVFINRNDLSLWALRLE
jgi:hypothetical protein